MINYKGLYFSKSRDIVPSSCNRITWIGPDADTTLSNRFSAKFMANASGRAITMDYLDDFSFDVNEAVRIIA